MPLIELFRMTPKRQIVKKIYRLRCAHDYTRRGNHIILQGPITTLIRQYHHDRWQVRITYAFTTRDLNGTDFEITR